MPKTSVGIYISPKYVDIVELSGSSRSPLLSNFIRQEIPPEPVSNGLEVEGDRPLEKDGTVIAVKEGLKKLSSKTQSVQTVLSSSDVMIRYFDMPVLPKSEQTQAVKFEAKKYVPFKLDEITSDFRFSASAKNKRTMGVFFIAATKKHINSYMAKFKAAGTSLSGIDIIPFALWRIMLLNKKVETKEIAAILYVDNDRESISIHIIEESAPFISRDLKINVDDKEAVFEKLASELRVSIEYYNRQKPDSVITKIILCGEPLFSGMDAYIADELQIATDTLYDFNRLKVSDKLPSSAIISFGSALEGLGRSNYSINLSPLRDVIKHKKMYRIMAMEAAAALAVIVLVYISANLLTGGVRERLKAIKKEHASIPGKTLSLGIKALEKRKEQILKGVEALMVLVNDRPSLAVKLSRVADDLNASNTDRPEGLWIDKLNFYERFMQDEAGYPSGIVREIIISGSSFSLDADKNIFYVDNFFALLKEDAVFMNYFSNINLVSIDKHYVQEYEVSEFKISAQQGDLQGLPKNKRDYSSEKTDRR